MKEKDLNYVCDLVYLGKTKTLIVNMCNVDGPHHPPCIFVGRFFTSVTFLLVSVLYFRPYTDPTRGSRLVRTSGRRRILRVNVLYYYKNELDQT